MVWWDLDNVLKKKIINVLEKLPKEKIAEVFDFVEYLRINKNKNKEDNEINKWLNIEDEWPEYEWGEEGPPEGEKVKFVRGIGLMIEGD